MNLKIREAQVQKIPYMLIIGDKEQASESVAVRLRSGDDLGVLSLTQFKERFRDSLHAKDAAKL